jgi:hypothetical protein
MVNPPTTSDTPTLKLAMPLLHKTMKYISKNTINPKASLGRIGYMSLK